MDRLKASEIYWKLVTALAYGIHDSVKDEYLERLSEAIQAIEHAYEPKELIERKV